MTTHWHYFQHVPSGERYAISIGENGMFGDISGPLKRTDLTLDGLITGFDYDEDDRDWMGAQTWRMVGPDNPACDCL